MIRTRRLCRFRFIIGADAFAEIVGRLAAACGERPGSHEKALGRLAPIEAAEEVADRAGPDHIAFEPHWLSRSAQAPKTNPVIQIALTIDLLLLSEPTEAFPSRLRP